MHIIIYSRNYVENFVLFVAKKKIHLVVYCMCVNAHCEIL